MAAAALEVDPVFRLLSASYGSPGSSFDVTAKLVTLIDSNGELTRQIKSFNSFFGRDPAPGIVKTLLVRYSKNGVELSISFIENTAIYLLPYDFAFGSSIRKNTTIQQDQGLRRFSVLFLFSFLHMCSSFFRVSVDGSHILVQQRDGNLVVYNVSSGKPCAEWATDE
jgi:hypothetical protein